MGAAIFLIGASRAGPNGSSSGASYAAVRGRDTAQAGAFLVSLNLRTSMARMGFRLNGVAADDRSGFGGERCGT